MYGLMTSNVYCTYCSPDIAPVNSVRFSHIHTFASIASQPERERERRETGEFRHAKRESAQRALSARVEKQPLTEGLADGRHNNAIKIVHLPPRNLVSLGVQPLLPCALFTDHVIGGVFSRENHACARLVKRARAAMFPARGNPCMYNTCTCVYVLASLKLRVR